MEVLLTIILFVAGLSLALNATFILHELGWLPHGKRRDRPSVQRLRIRSGYLPTIEEARANDNDVQTHGPFTHLLRRYGHPKVYELKEPEAQLKSVLERFREEPTPSRRDDLLNLMNVITTRTELTEELDALVEEGIAAVQEPVFAAGEGR